LVPYRGADRAGRQVDKVRDELVGMLRLDAERIKQGSWEVPDVVRHDCASLAADRSRHDVPIVGIWQVDMLGEAFIPRHEAVGYRRVHQLPRVLELFPREVLATLKHGADPLFMDLISPSRTVQIRERKPQQEVTERCWVQHAGIEEGDESRHASVPEPEVLGLVGQFVEGLLSAD
jgi:hypothetical protein